MINNKYNRSRFKRFSGKGYRSTNKPSHYSSRKTYGKSNPTKDYRAKAHKESKVYDPKNKKYSVKRKYKTHKHGSSYNNSGFNKKTSEYKKANHIPGKKIEEPKPKETTEENKKPSRLTPYVKTKKAQVYSTKKKTEEKDNTTAAVIGGAAAGAVAGAVVAGKEEDKKPAATTSHSSTSTSTSSEERPHKPTEEVHTPKPETHKPNPTYTHKEDKHYNNDYKKKDKYSKSKVYKKKSDPKKGYWVGTTAEEEYKKSHFEREDPNNKDYHEKNTQDSKDKYTEKDLKKDPNGKETTTDVDELIGRDQILSFITGKPVAKSTDNVAKLTEKPIVYIPNESLELDKTSVYTTTAATRRRVIKDGIATELDPTLKRYYSAIEAEIYLGSEFVEDISSIHYTIQQNNLPIYGFNSYTYDALAIGSRIVQGYFTINFTSPNYLFKILEEIDGISQAQNFFLRKTIEERNLLEPAGAIDERFKGHVNGNKFKELYPKTFDIDIVYGAKTRISNPAHVIITGVRIISCEVQISAHDPNALVEAYTFVGQDIRTIQ